MAFKDAVRRPRFIMFDGRTAVMLVFFLVWPRMYTAYALMGTIVFFYVLDKNGLRLETVFRLSRSWFSNKVRVARPTWRMQRYMN